jgi:hypothetical protein
MSMLKREENMVKSRGIVPLRQMIVYELCMKFHVVLNPPYTKYTITKRTRNTRLWKRGLYDGY